MSLYALADHMASKGRNGDSVLVHMTPGEVQGLQALALAHGGSLTINPETGLPEANFLKKLLPAVAGFALNAFVPGLGSAIGGALGVSAAAGTGIAVGGLSALATGSLSRGLMAGLGAYGGAGLAEGLMGAGAGAAQQAAMSGLTQEQIAQRVAEENLANMATATTEQGVRNQLAADAAKGFASKTASQQLGAGFGAAAADPMGFAKSAAKPLMLAAMGADAMVPTSTKMPSSAQSPSYIRPYIFDQYTQGLQALPVIDASTIRKKTSGMAGGGVVALANGGAPAPGSAQYVENVRNWFAERPEATHADIQAAIAKYGLDPADVQAAMQQAGMSGAARYSAESPVIGSTANVEEDYSGLKGLSSNINYWLAQNPTATLADVQNEMQRWDISDEDILRATGKSLEELFAPKKTVQPTQGPIELFTPSPVSDVQRPYGSGPATGIDYKGREVSIATPGDVIFNPDGSTTVVPNIPGRPTGGFTGTEQLKSAYTAGGGSLGQTNLFVPKTAEEMFRRYVNTGGSKQAYDYLMGRGMAGGGIVALADGGMSVADLYKTYAGREADPGGLQYWTEKFGGSVDPTEAAAFRAAIAEARTAGTEPMMAQPAAAEAVQNMYRNVLGRDVEQSGLDYWTQQMQQAADPTQVYQEFLAGAQANKEIGRAGLGFEQAVQPYTGYTSSDANTYADEWVRNVLGREVTAADRQQPWYQQLLTTSTPEQTQKAYEDFLRSTGAKTGMDVMQASQLREFTPRTGPTTLFTPSPVPEARTPYGSGPATGIDYQGREVSIATPGDKTINPDQSVTVTPNIPGRPYGGFTGIEQLKSAYTAGGGSLGQTNLFVPRTVEEMYERYGNTGGSQQAYDYLMGKGAVDIKKPILKTGELMLPYAEVMGLRPQKTFVLPKKPEPKTKVPAATQEEVEGTASTGAAAGGVMRMALGGLGALAGGGQAGYNLGGYSDGGRLLKGPGDGVSDSIPATIGGRQPARLADGEFVIPARIVSEIGNGSTDAGARKLYAMMDRVQRARGKTTGKGRVAKDTKAEKYLPA